MATRPSGAPVIRHKKKQEESLTLRACHYIKKNYPHAVFIFDIAAGLDLTPGQRIKMMRTRSDDGMSDIHVLTPNRGYHGLILELKKEGEVVFKKDGTLRKAPYTRRFKDGRIKKGDHLAEQAAYLKKMNELGYYGRFSIGFDNFTKYIDWYFENEQTSLF